MWPHDLKLQRASQHLKELKAEIDGWVEGDGYSIRIEPDPDPQCREYKIKANILREITEDPFSLLIGDFLQNARAALDYIAFALGEAGADDGMLDDETALNAGFPIVGDVDREGFSGRGGDRFDELAARKIPTVTEAVRAIIERSQPYYTGGELWASEPLWHLHELARFDRHRFLHPAAVHTGEVRLDPGLRNVLVRDFEATWGERVIEEPDDWDDDSASLSAVLATFTAKPRDPKKKMQVEPLAELVLGFDGDTLPSTLPLLAGDEVSFTLSMIEWKVRDILRELAAHLPSR